MPGCYLQWSYQNLVIILSKNLYHLTLPFFSSYPHLKQLRALVLVDKQVVVIRL